MSLTAIAPGGNAPVDAYSRANLVSLCIMDSGSGGNLYVNGAGIVNAVVTGALDLKTFFGTAFRSVPLLTVFRPIAGVLSNTTAENRLVQHLDVKFTSLGNPGATVVPSVLYLIGLSPGPNNVPYLAVTGPGSAGTWRMDLRLRHSIGE